MAMSIFSYSYDSFFPSRSMVTLRFLDLFSLISTTFDPNMMVSNCFFSFLSNGLTISPSAPGIKLGKNSTSDTLEPSVAYTCPSSTPITPPPMINILLGMFSRSSAVRDVSIFLLSGMLGSDADEDPAAMIQKSNVMVCFAPSIET